MRFWLACIFLVSEFFLKNSLKNINQLVGRTVSRPSSAMSSFFRSVSSDDIHGRIALTLKMIEQDEQQRESLKSSSFPEMLETIKIPGSTSDNIVWSNLPNFAYPASLASTAVSEYGTRPSSQASIHNTQQRPQLVNNFMQQQRTPSEEMPHPMNSAPHSSHSQSHFVQNCNNFCSNGNESVTAKTKIDFVMPQVPPQHRKAEPPVIAPNPDTSRSHSPFNTCSEKARYD